jgi:hypothetical protein
MKNPAILGEPLMVIGRQVQVPEIRDRLDILALDVSGNAVIVELKRGKLTDPVDIQALRYASYVSKWPFKDFERLAKNHLGRGKEDFNLNAAFEEFCSGAGVDEAPDINGDQRVIIVGTGVRDKLGSVALWLHEHHVDIKVIEVHAYKQGNEMLIEPSVIVPLPVSKFADTGRAKGEGAPWLTDGRAWHLDQRCSGQTGKWLLQIDDILRDNFDLEGPRWNQKHYVAYRIAGVNWLSTVTSTQTLRLDFLVKKGMLTGKKVAKMLGVEEFDRDESMSEKMNLPSSVFVKNRNDKTDRLYLRIREGFDMSGAPFMDFLKLAYKAAPKSIVDET